MYKLLLILILFTSCGKDLDLFRHLLGEHDNNETSQAYVLGKKALYCSQEAMRLYCTVGVFRPTTEVLPPRVFMNYSCHVGYLKCLEGRGY